MTAETERPGPVTLAPGIEVRADVQGGQPVIAGTRLTTDAPYGYWRAGWPATCPPEEAYPAVAPDRLRAAIAFEAGRRYERQQTARDKRRRWVGTVNDADAHRAAGYAEGLAAAAAYLRDSGRGDWAVVLTETLREREGEG